MAARELPTADTEGGSVLTDDYNPLDDLQRELFVAWRRNAISTFNRPGPRIVESLEILLGMLHPELTPTHQGVTAP